MAANFSPERLTESLVASNKDGSPPYQTYQRKYNLYARGGFESKLHQICVDNQIGVISYYALASGFLTGKYRSTSDLGRSQRGGGVENYLNERGFRILKALDEVSAEYNSTPAAVSLAWLIAQPAVAAPIASATSLQHLESFTQAVKLKLTEASLAQLTEASAY